MSQKGSQRGTAADAIADLLRESGNLTDFDRLFSPPPPEPPIVWPKKLDDLELGVDGEGGDPIADAETLAAEDNERWRFLSPFRKLKPVKKKKLMSEQQALNTMYDLYEKKVIARDQFRTFPYTSLIKEKQTNYFFLLRKKQLSRKHFIRLSRTWLMLRTAQLQTVCPSS